ncbi:MAG: ASCH domain-containing protein [Candidatus Anammoxibacter sp.]
MKDREKDITRRLGWWFLKPGDIVMAVEKCMGLKKGEKVKRLYPIQIISTKPEILAHISIKDCKREGFPELKRHEFVLMFIKHNNCNSATVINRIEFKEINGGLNGNIKQ